MESLDRLEVLANVLQVLNYIMNVEDAKNTDILKELQNQNSKYLEKIIEQNQIIIDMLKER